MSEANVLKVFRGYVSVSDGRAVLTAGGIEAELLPDESAPPGDEERRAGRARAVESFEPYAGQKVRVYGRQEGGEILGARVAEQPESAADPRAEAESEAFEDVVSVLRTQRGRLEGYDGVVKGSARPGYRVVKGVLTETPALVVTVERKLPAAMLADGEVIPTSLGGVPVDVRQAGPAPADGDGAAFDWEHFFTNGAPPPTAEAAPVLSYERWEKHPLAETRVRSITCHVSPDAGLEQLQAFLAETSERLTAAIYDFHSEEVFEALLSAAEAGGELSLIIDPDKKKPDETTEGGFQKRLKTRLKEGFKNWSWAATGGPEPLFLNSYHTKVTVRDGETFWLSSGNWTHTSQPVIPPGPQPQLYSKGNREWHVIVEDKGLSELFEAYILRDIEQARERLSGTEAAPAAREMPDLLVPESFFAEPEAMAVQPEPFRPRTFTSANGILVQPLLSPDNYVEKVLSLIEKAERSLYFQYSYIRLPKEEDRFMELIRLIARKIKEGLDVRLIASARNQAAADTEGLARMGLTADHFRLQKSKLHNKGILVDSKKALVSSQNWSRDGVLYNRDAGLIIHDARVARYFEKVFLFDWDNLTRPTGEQEFAPVAAPPEMEATPAGMVRVPWRSFYDE
jgi:phosphatidylserine/phosphatidylglycerophosphate/cardiolipin synthase-like enzyme